MSNKLTPNQEHVYLFIREYITQNKHSPFLREIQQACNIKSHKVTIDRLTALERKGYIKRKINQHRSIRLVNHNKNLTNIGGYSGLEK
jgi:SOS-response transcriptional repressor LexA